MDTKAFSFSTHRKRGHRSGKVAESMDGVRNQTKAQNESDSHCPVIGALGERQQLSLSSFSQPKVNIKSHTISTEKRDLAKGATGIYWILLRVRRNEVKLKASGCRF